MADLEQKSLPVADEKEVVTLVEDKQVVDVEGNMTQAEMDDVELQDAMDVAAYLDFIVPKSDDPSTPAFT
jgi:hypothetical protein